MIKKEYSYILREALDESQKTVAFTGAGVSLESGIPTFRGDTGIWRSYHPAIYGNLPGLALAFLIKTKKFASFIHDVLGTFATALPNPAHIKLAHWEREGRIVGVITQNVDNLHQEAGSREVLELHGNIYRLRCPGCGRKYTLEKQRLLEISNQLNRLLEGGKRISRLELLSLLRKFAARCEACARITRPDVVFFGEPLPRLTLEMAFEWSSSCDLFLSIGTSGVVQPAASLPFIAKRSGAKLIEINTEPSAITRYADVFIPTPAAKLFLYL